jgi:ketosteroid isomerase-like protein
MTPLEVVEHGYAAFGRGDLPALLSLLAEDVEWRLTADAQTPYGGKHLGKAAVQRWFQVLAESDEIQQFEPREFLEGSSHVTVLGWERSRPLPNGVPFESEWVHVFTVADGKITRFVGTLDTAARAAALRDR